MIFESSVIYVLFRILTEFMKLVRFGVGALFPGGDIEDGRING